MKNTRVLTYFIFGSNGRNDYDANTQPILTAKCRLLKYIFKSRNFGLVCSNKLLKSFINCRECTLAHVAYVLDAQTQNGDEPVGEYSFLGQSCLSSADS